MGESESPPPTGRVGRRGGRLMWWLAGVIVVATAIAGLGTPAGRSVVRSAVGRSAAATAAQSDIAAAAAISPLRGRIVAIAESQVGYRTDPANTYCNKYSAYWASGTADCNNTNLDEEWCADFAAWVWKQAGASVTYQYVSGDLDASAASFYEWGLAHGTWHPVGSGYLPQPGDVAVYGLDTATLYAQHVAIVVNFANGARGPDAINGDGDHTGFSVVELGNDEYQADIPGVSPALVAGYVAPD